MVKHTQTIRRQEPTNCLSVFDHLWGCRLKVKNTLKNREKHPWGSVTFIKVAGFRIFREAKASHITIILSKLL